MKSKEEAYLLYWSLKCKYQDPTNFNLKKWTCNELNIEHLDLYARPMPKQDLW